MHNVLLEVTKAPFVVAPFIVVSVDEVTTIDNTQWLSIHLYVVQKWRHIPILLCVETVSLFATSYNIFSSMVKCMLDFDGLGVEEIVGKLVSIGCDESNVFQGHRTSMTTQFKNKVVPFITRVHCFAHRTNMTVITLSNVSLMHQLEDILQSMYVFFSHSLKKFAKFQKLVDLFNTKGNKILQNVKTHWILIFFLQKECILNIYLSL